MKRPVFTRAGFIISIFPAALFLCCFLLFFTGTARAGTMLVTNTNDSGAGSLRQAILDANSNPGADTIEFNIPGPGTHTISPVSWLPAFTDVVTVDGYSQPGAARATDTAPATVLIELDGSAAGSNVGGLYFWNDTNGSRVSGLAINRWDRNGIYVLGGDGMRIDGNYIGTDPAGTVGLGNIDAGIIIQQECSNNVIVGGADPGERNVISGNTGDGVTIVYASGCSIQGNYIGTDATGTAAIANGGDGINIYGGYNTVGGTTPGAGNLISGNANNGVCIGPSSHDKVEGNFIGTNAQGSAALANGWHGIDVEGDNATIGGTTASARNVISGNSQQGINVHESSGTAVKANYVGTDSGGSVAVPNQWSGICLTGGCKGITIGGATAAERNVLSGNGFYGADLQGSSSVQVKGNYIGTNSNGNAAVGNNYTGICVWNSCSNVSVGGAAAGEGNVVSGNGTGVSIAKSSSVKVKGNLIGTDATGSFGIGNGWGVYADSGSDGATVGGAAAGEGNVISANTYGVFMTGCSGVQVAGNRIGTNAAGTLPLGNTSEGVYLYQKAGNNTIGGKAEGAGNVISGNTKYGVHVYQSTGNTLQGNYIGTNSGGTRPLPNGGVGVYVESGSDGTTVGGDGAGNHIACNGKDGVGIKSSVGCEVNGNAVRSNSGTGVVVWDKGSYTNEISKNSFYGNGGLGIDLGGDGVTPNDGNNNNPDKPNRGYNFPVITRSCFLRPDGTAVVAGTAPPNSSVEIYWVGPDADPSGHGQGLGYLDTAKADRAGDFTASIEGLKAGQSISAIAISPEGDPSGQGNTSEFSGNATVVVPSIAGCEPASGVQGHTVNVDITGSNTHFEDGTSVAVFSGDGITVNSTHVSDDNHATAGITISGDAAPGFRDVNVVTGGEKPRVLERGFEVKQVPPGPPRLDSIDPTSGPVGTYVRLDGEHFADAQGSSFVSFNGARADTYTSWSDGRIVCRAPGDATTGPVTVTTPAGVSNGMTFTVQAPPDPVILDCEPTSAVQGHSIELNVLGGNTHFRNGESRATVSGGGVEVSTTFASDETHATAHLAVAPDAKPGARSVNVVTGSETPSPLDHVFTIHAAPAAPPRLEGIHPSRGSVGDVVSITGRRLGAVRGSSFLTFNGVRVGNYISWSDHEVVCAVPVGARTGNVVAHAPWGTSNGLAFIVNHPAFYFAEGTCRPNFDPYLTVQNPGSSATRALITYMKGDGTTRRQTLDVPAATRATITVKDVLGQGYDAAHDFSARVESTGYAQIVAERPMYFDYREVWTGGSDVVGATAPSRTFYFAEGTCRPGFEPYLAIQNPGASEARIRITYMTGNGGTRRQDLTVPPTARATVAVKSVLGEGDDPGHDFSARVACTNGRAVVAERPMYFNYQGAWTGGSDVVGATSPAEAFYFAEGTCRPGFDPYVTVQNPTKLEARVKITYMKGDGTTSQQVLAVPATSRETVRVKDVLGVGDGAAHDFSAKVESLNNVDIVAERPMYFNYKGAWTGGTGVVGALSPSTAFYFAEGTCRPGFEPYLTIQNPGLAAAQVKITYMMGDGATREQLLTVPATARATVIAKDVLGEGDDAAHDFSAKVECFNNKTIVAERPMYFNYKGAWTGGSDVVGFSP